MQCNIVDVTLAPHRDGVRMISLNNDAISNQVRSSQAALSVAVLGQNPGEGELKKSSSD